MRRNHFFLPLILVLFLAGCSGPFANSEAVSPEVAGVTNESDTSSSTRIDQQGAVTVTVTPSNLESTGKTFDFDVSLQTHSVDLSMDLGALSTLEVDTGVQVSASAWNGPKGGHHVKGTLSFPASQDGQPILTGAKTLTLIIQKVDAEKRSFTWEVTNQDLK